MAKSIKIKLVKSTNSSNSRQKATVKALGLNKIGQTVEKKENEATLGMINTVSHLVEVTQE